MRGCFQKTVFRKGDPAVTVSLRNAGPAPGPKPPDRLSQKEPRTVETEPDRKTAGVNLRRSHLVLVDYATKSSSESVQSVATESTAHVPVA
jgi:hypothetical protein